MKTKNPVQKALVLGGSLVIVFAVSLFAQTTPTITLQPTNQVVPNGSTATFSVTAVGSGPFTYQWQFNGNEVGFFITTVAGNGSVGFSGDGGLARNASLDTPAGVAVDSVGNMYIADYLRIRKVDTNSHITTFAGNGIAGFSGDGGAATYASLRYPAGVAVDSAGNVYIADPQNDCIRKVDTNGVITRAAGTGGGGYYGDGGAATNANLNYPQGVATDCAGNLYIADMYNWRIRKVDTNGLITTVAGNGIAGFSGDGGAATNASLDLPQAMATDSVGNLYIADYANARVRKVDTNGFITTVAGNGSGGFHGDGGASTNASLLGPEGVATDSVGNLYIADADKRIRKVDTNGLITTVAGNGSGGFSGDGGVATNASLNLAMGSASGIAMDSVGNLYIADAGNYRIRKAWPANLSTMTLSGVSANSVGDYSVIVSGAGGSVTSSVASLNLPPYITVQPASQLVLVGSNLDMSVVAAGSGPLVTAWYFAGTNVLQSGTNTTFKLPDVGMNDGGDYMVVISNNYGSVTSQIATATILPLRITLQPRNQTAAAGGSPSFSAAAAGVGPFGFAWYFGGTNLLQSGTNNTLTLPGFGMNNVGNYTVVITNNYGSVTSQIATLTGAFPPSVAEQPVNQTTSLGTPVRFGVVANGTGPFTYQWQFNGTNLTNIISTFAGGASGGDGGAAISAGLYNPVGVASDAAGNLYISDQSNSRIRKVDTNGIITTVAGSIISGYAGDGGTATNAYLKNPGGVAVDAFGNLYIADQYNNRIRKVDTNGIITTVAGNRDSGYSGDGGAATNTSLYYPVGVVLDTFGNLYIADQYNNRIRKVDANGIITTVAGSSTPPYSGDGGAATNAYLDNPVGVAVDSAGDLYIADQGNNRVRKVDTNGIITTVAGNGGFSYSGDGGAATSASLSSPAGVALDSLGNLYVADAGNNRIRKIDLDGFIVTLAGKSSAGFSGDFGAPTNAALHFPEGLCFDPTGNLYIADASNRRVRKVALAGGSATFTLNQSSINNAGNYTVTLSNPYGSITSSVATLTIISPPVITEQPANQVVGVGGSPSFSVTVAGSGPFGYDWYYGDTNLMQEGMNNTLIVPNASTNANGNYWVVITNAYGSTTSQIATLTVALPPALSAQPVSQTNLAGTIASFNVGVGGIGPFSYQWQFNGTNLPNNIITTVAGNGGNFYSGDGGPATNASLNGPTGVTFDSSGNLYICDRWNNRVRKVDSNGIISTVAGGGSGTDGGAATNARLAYPTRSAFDAFGNLFIADQGYSRIRKVDKNGIITTVAGGGNSVSAGNGMLAINFSLDQPSGVALDSFGNLYIADSDNEYIRQVTPNGVITSIAGTWNGGYSGDGGAATNASLSWPQGLVCDATGTLYL